ncbi:hypothetical protein BC829DRAFT_379479 [Chytridium lagenaria]|nr:hypothetical protein BC829DRAFT_379479 [Chytridium lagenaria]
MHSPESPQPASAMDRNPSRASMRSRSESISSQGSQSSALSAKWIPDHEATVLQCGRVICHSCSQFHNIIILVSFQPITKKVRVCTDCKHDL